MLLNRRDSNISGMQSSRQIPLSRRPRGFRASSMSSGSSCAAVSGAGATSVTSVTAGTRSVTLVMTGVSVVRGSAKGEAVGAATAAGVGGLYPAREKAQRALPTPFFVSQRSWRVVNTTDETPAMANLQPLRGSLVVRLLWSCQRGSVRYPDLHLLGIVRNKPVPFTRSSLKAPYI
jgi:hypothetical protein